MASNFQNFVVYIAVLSAFIGVSLACNGYKVKVHKIENCYKGNDAVIQVSDDWDVDLDDNCNIVAQGCVKVKAFKTALAKFKFVKPPIPPVSGELDICTAVEQYGDLIDPYLDLLQLPKRCPVSDMDICFDGTKKISVSQYRDRLGMALGKLDLSLDIAHDTGRSCIRAIIEVTKRNR